MTEKGKINLKTDTIAAIATAISNAGISIIRISGEEAFTIIDKIYKSPKGNKKLSEQSSHTAHYGYIVDGEEVIDEVIVLIMKAPSTYTREDVVEINCHGGMIVTKKVLETVFKYGARPADPGEFTKRAFLNGRIDLSQAEAVIDVINAKNEYALQSSVKQLRGGIQDKIKAIRENVLYDIAYIEAALDDPEHMSLEGFDEELSTHVNGNIEKIDKLLDTANNGRIIKEGIQTVILGKPNAGKSSLLNILVGEDRAIVTDIAGTTRDTLQESINLHGIMLNIIDTAGIRETEDVVEKIGVNKAKESAKDADLIIYVIDGSRELDENDFEIIELIQDRKAVVLVNKSDLDMVVNVEEIEKKTNKKVFKISAKDNTGIEEFELYIKDMFFEGKLSFNDEIYITNLRHKSALMDSKESLEKVMESIQAGMPEDFYSIDLMSAYEKLGEIIGESVDEDVVNKIFKEFCMGK
ncbi:GTPase and tRNA-U34 5-formylation enzyme TrmE [Lachnospiraceae bacterium KM106-2]|nr:GTPase and tRNA-U34 5-formylation enzyme TrmE [Lachnospiraceae bacterium KM106-2]